MALGGERLFTGGWDGVRSADLYNCNIEFEARCELAILPKGARPELGPESFGELDRAIIAGFTCPGRQLRFGEQKILAGRLRARHTAVEIWLSEGVEPSHRQLAERLGVSDRCLSYQFPRKGELYAFPPPELGRALIGAATSSRSWSEFGLLVRSMFDAMDTNEKGRSLMIGLISLRRANPEVCDTDAYFLREMRAACQNVLPRRTLPIANLLTGGVRMAFEDWVDIGAPNLIFVSDRIERFLVGPVRTAFEAMLGDPEGPSTTSTDDEILRPKLDP